MVLLLAIIQKYHKVALVVIMYAITVGLGS